MIAMMISKEKLFTQWFDLQYNYNVYRKNDFMWQKNLNYSGETEFNPRWDEPKEAQDS